MNSPASLLLQKQLKELQRHPVEGFSAGLKDDNIFHWEVCCCVVFVCCVVLCLCVVLCMQSFWLTGGGRHLLTGPLAGFLQVMIMPQDGSLYSGGMFRAELMFPEDYPSNPPKMRFVGVR